MKALVLFRLWLLLQLFASTTVFSQTAPTDLVEKPECKTEMVCFSSKACTSGGNTLIKIDSDAPKVSSSCPAILKIRAYSNHYWLVILESSEATVTDITVTHGPDTLLSCVNAGSEIVGHYKSERMDLISKKGSPLKCEFYVRPDGSKEIFTKDTQILSLTTKGVQTSAGMDADTFFVKATCDPTMISRVNKGVVDDKFIEAIDGKEMRLSCPSGYALEYKDSVFKPVDNITCEKEVTSSKYVYVVKENNVEIARKEATDKFDARCALPTCTKCTLPSVSTTKVKPYIPENKSNSCMELKCAKGQLKAGGRKSDAAKCKYLDGKNFWELDGLRIDDSSAVNCIPEYPCDEKNDLSAVCKKGPANSRCFVAAKDRLPYCSHGQLEVNGLKGNITCDEDSEEYQFRGAALPTDAKLSCGASSFDEDSSALEACKAQPKKSGTGVIAGVCITIVLIIVSGAGVVYQGLTLRQHLQERAEGMKSNKAVGEKLKARKLALLKKEKENEKMQAEHQPAQLAAQSSVSKSKESKKSAGLSSGSKSKESKKSTGQSSESKSATPVAPVRKRKTGPKSPAPSQ